MIIHSPIISGSLSFSNGSTLNVPDGTILSGSFSGSIDGIGDPSTFSASIASDFSALSTDYNDLQNVPAGIISSSAQIDTLFNIDGVVSGSEQIVDVLSSLNSYTSSNDTTNSTQTSRLDQLSTYTGSNDTAQTAQDSRLDHLSTETGSIADGQAEQDSRLNHLSSYTGSNDTVNSTQNNRLDQLSSYTASNDSNNTGQDSRLDNLESFSSSIETAITVDGFDVTIAGNLTVAGTQTIVDSTTVSIGDNIIELNGSGATNGGIYVKDATAPNTDTGSLIWDSTNDYWKAGTLGSEIKILRADGDGVVSGSNQITLSDTVGFTSFSQSFETTDDVLAERALHLEDYTASNDSVQSAQTNRINNLELYSASNDTTNTTQDGRLDNLESTTSSIDTAQTAQDSRLDQLSTETGSIATIQTTQTDRLDQLSSATASIADEQTIQDGRLENLELFSSSQELKDSSLSSYTSSNDGNITQLFATASDHESRVDALETFSSSIDIGFISEAELAAATGALETKDSAQDARLNHLSTYTSSADALNSGQDARLDYLSTYTASNDDTNTIQDGRLSNLESFTSSLDTDLATLSVPANTTISAFGKTLVDDADASTARTTLGVDEAGTDNSTDVTLAGSYDYITISGQEITRNQITNDDLANSSITISGTSVSLGGSITDETLFGGTGIVSGSIQILGGSTILSSSTQNFTEFSSSVADTFAGLSTNYNDLQNIPSGIISSSTQIDDLFNIDGIVSGSPQIVDVLASLNAYTASNDTTNSTQNSRLNQLSTETGSISTEQSAQDSRLTQLETKTGSLDSTNTSQNSRLSNLEAETGSITTEQSSQDGRLSNLESFTSSLDTDLATLSVPANTTISAFGKTLVDDASAGAARTTLGVDAAGTDNSTNVTLAGSYDYITISGQEITRNQVDASTDISNLTTANVSEVTNLYYTDTRVKTKLTAEAVVSGSASQVRSFINVEDGADVTDAANVVSSLVGATGISAPNKTTIQSNLGVDAAGTDNSTNVTLAGSYDYITISGQVITRGQIDASTDISNLTTTNVSEGTNKYATTANVKTALNANLGTLTLGDSDDTISIPGNLTVSGTTNFINSQTLNIGDNNIVLNADVTGTPSSNGGITIERGTETNATLIWDETNDYWKAGLAGAEVQVALVNGTYSGLRAQSTTKGDVGLGNVENTTLSTWAGSSNITTLGTIGTGVWNGTAITDGYISSATAWNAKLDSAGTIATNDYAKYDANGDLTGRSYSEVRTDLGLVIGTNVQAYNATLAAVAGGTYTGDDSITTLGTISTGTWNGTAIASAYLDADTAHLSSTQTFSGAKTFSAAVNISNATASTTKTTGALIVTGGVGVSGALNVGGDVVAYASSDERLKDNIELISNPIEKVQQLKGVTWEWNENADELQQSLPNVGVIAQDVEKVLPQLVHDRDNGFKGVDYAKLTGLLIEAIKEQQKQIDELKSKLG